MVHLQVKKSIQLWILTTASCAFAFSVIRRNDSIRLTRRIKYELHRATNPAGASESTLDDSVRTSSSSATKPERTTSLAHVDYNSVIQAMDGLYLPSEEAMRNAQSRTDGYWPYVGKNEDPPPGLTYGEFDIAFLAQLLDRAASWKINGEISSWQECTFCDIGSGTGRVVIAAAALHPNFKECRGVEILPKIHSEAVKYLSKCVLDNKTKRRVLLSSGGRVGDSGSVSAAPPLDLAPVVFRCASATEPCSLDQVDLAFVFSTCMPAELMGDLSRAVIDQMVPYSLAITIDQPFPSSVHLELLEVVDGSNPLVGGVSRAYLYRVI